MLGNKVVIELINSEPNIGKTPPVVGCKVTIIVTDPTEGLSHEIGVTGEDEETLSTSELLLN
jgi:hypothetical protein